jgi:hypothetical protein
MESYYATNKTYVGAANDDDVKKLGVLGSGNDQASIDASNDTSYTLVGHSASGNQFTIAKTSSSPGVTRTCSTTNKGACPSNGKW